VEADAFLAQLRMKRGAVRDVEVPDAPPLREAPSFVRFSSELARVGGQFSEITRSQAAGAVLDLARARGSLSFICSDTPLIRTLEIAPCLCAAGLEQIRYPNDLSSARQVLNRAAIGIVEADLTLAESGTIGLIADVERSRLVSCLPRILVVLIDPRTLLARLEEVPAWLAARGALPSALALLTGPSRTGDIEAQLVIGAHGPAELHSFLVTDLAAP